MPQVYTTGDYADRWKIVDSLDQQGLYKSAQEEVVKIRETAESEKNGPQILKTLIFEGKYTTFLEEDGIVKAIALFENALPKLNEPDKSVLNSMLGEVYAQYLQAQYWSIKDRTPLADESAGDIRTWSTAYIEKRAFGYYASSIEAFDLLRATPVDYLSAISFPGTGDTVTGPLRPTVFDFLAHRALSHFTNERSYLTEPIYKFYLDNPAAFAPAAAFAQAKFESQDPESSKYRAILTFQKVLQAHMADADKSALIDADLLRLDFVRNAAVLPEKEALYNKALETAHTQYKGHPSDAEVLHRLAQYYYGLDEINPVQKTLNTKKAIAYAEEGVAAYPKSAGAAQCRALLHTIRDAYLAVQTEQVYLPERDLLAQVMYRNCAKIYTKVVLFHAENSEIWEGIPYENRLEVLNKAKVVREKTWNIPDPGDFAQHTTEIAFDPLPVGTYALMTSENAEFSANNGYVTYNLVSVSRLAPIPIVGMGQTKFVVTDRETGAPISQVTAEIFSREYNYNARKSEKRYIGAAQSDQNGVVNAPIPISQYAFMRFVKGADTLWANGGFSTSPIYQQQPFYEVQFFTDRSIYRPGQSVYYKCIVLKRGTESLPSIAPDFKFNIKFFDANGQEKASTAATSNAFGTFNGVFTAPTNGLTGEMTIQVDGNSPIINGSTTILVEEYKRPKFEVVFQPQEGAFRLGEQITAKGIAKAFAGNVVDGAQVNYRVVRQARFPYWWSSGWFYRPCIYNTEQMEIANGETTTGADGMFAVTFNAQADPSVPKKDLPVFDFTVYADVTDITGEVRSSEMAISIGYTALQVNLDLPEEITQDSLQKVALKTTNNAGKFEPATGTITLQPLLEPKQAFAVRYWSTPDQWAMSEADFRKKFPDFAWKDEDNPEKWPKKDISYPFQFNTATSQTVDLNQGKIAPGTYEVILRTTDAYGEKVEIKKMVRVVKSAKQKASYAAFSFAAEKQVLQPGETASILAGAGSGTYKVLFFKEKKDQLADLHWVDAAPNCTFEFPIVESDRGGVVASGFTVKNNRFYGSTQAFTVPWSNKSLQITYETFRDKLAPGGAEEWRLKISGPDKEKVAAEMVAGMYDASLDVFMPHYWGFSPYPRQYALWNIQGNNTFLMKAGASQRIEAPQDFGFIDRGYRAFNWYGMPLYGYNSHGGMLRRQAMMKMEDSYEEMLMVAPAAEIQMDKGNINRQVGADASGKVTPPAPPEPKTPAPSPAPIRRNLQETVFFFPELHTDAEGNVIVKFTMNEALTRWKFMAFAHTKDLKFGLTEKEVVTQKELMVQTNAPRFLREGDEMYFTAKVANLSQEKLSGTASLSLLDAVSLKPIEQQLGLTGPMRSVPFTVEPGQSVPVSWKINVPFAQLNGVTWQVFADAKSFRDGEESTIPVLTNRMLVTETMPITLRGKQTKSYTFDSFDPAKSTTLTPYRFTLEFTSNPVWYAVQALPYLMEYPHECSEQLFTRFYANTLAGSVTEKMPAIRRVFDRWKGTEAMKSNLSKNQELKSALLEETPWVMEAQSEAEQKQRIALLFDLNRMGNERQRALSQLALQQLPNGGFPWFPGGRDNWNITEYIVSGMGHLKKLEAFDVLESEEFGQNMGRALNYCDQQFLEHYQKVQRQIQEGKSKPDADYLDPMAVQHLYAASFFNQNSTPELDKAKAFYVGQMEKYWLSRDLYSQGMMALTLNRMGYTESAKKIVQSLKERAIQKEEMGMYWAFDYGYYFYQLPIETQAIMVEAFSEVTDDKKAVEELRIWLLKNKQTNRWSSTKATAEAVYALLLNGDNWLENTGKVSVKLGGMAISPQETEAGTGYFKQTWQDGEIKQNFKSIEATNPNSNIAWGAAYWQYFENLDQIKNFQKTPLTVVKTVYLQENTATGPVLKPLASGNSMPIGSKIKVRLELRVDRPMEFVHLKDMRAAGFEPVDVLSGYRWSDGLGYYQSTKDLATHFFIDYLPRGTYVMEYMVNATQRGDFSNGITTLQCMYAPEFSSHSEGIRVKVE